MTVLDLFSLKGKNALVPRSSQGLGAGTAIGFAQAGAHVTLHGHKDVSESTIEEVGKTDVQSLSVYGYIFIVDGGWLCRERTAARNDH